MRNKYLCALFFLLSALTGFSQTFDKAGLDKYLQILDSNHKWMGSVALAQHGKVLYTKSVGYADVDKKIKPDQNTKFRIGSISKTFTATLVLKAVEEQKLQLDEKLADYFPTIKNADKITISDLLYHRSGIHSLTDDSTYLQWNTTPKSEKELMDMIAKGGSDFEPGSKAEYSNSNFVILSFILEKIYKKPYAKILQEKIINPMKLTHTAFGGKINLKDNECYSYTPFGNSWKKENETDMSIPMGAGGIISTASDLDQFITGLFEGKIISTSTLAKMTTIKDGYGMGLFEIPFYEKRSYGHTGGIDGFTSMLGYFPEDTFSFALTSNGSDFKNNDIALALLSAWYGKQIKYPIFLTSEDLDKYLGVYSSKDIPLKITITKNGNTLTEQATGQPAFKLDATAKDQFKLESAGAVFEFKPAEKTMLLKQAGREFHFAKDE